MDRRKHPIVWVIGGTRSCKTAIAKNGIEPLGFHLVSTGDYFREHYAQPDTMNMEFVFNISAFAAKKLSIYPDCHLSHLKKIISEQNKPMVIEGERNPVEFAKLYDPKKDMVILVKRLDIPAYDTVIERGLRGIENIVQWNISTGITPRESVIKTTFGLEEIKCEMFGVNNADSEVYLKGRVPPKKETGTTEDKYPWINIVIGEIRHRIADFYGINPYLVPTNKPAEPARATAVTAPPPHIP